MIDRENVAAQAAMASSGNQGRYDGSLQGSQPAYQGFTQQQQGQFAGAQLSSPVYGASHWMLAGLWQRAPAIGFTDEEEIAILRIFQTALARQGGIGQSVGMGQAGSF